MALEKARNQVHPFRMRPQRGSGLSLVFMVGVGGRRFAARHVERTLALSEGLPLDSDDIVYLSPFRERQGSGYSARSSGEGFDALEAEELDRQYRALRDGLRARLPGVRVARYDIREFAY
jgi:hypothetical protein